MVQTFSVNLWFFNRSDLYFSWISMISLTTFWLSEASEVSCSCSVLILFSNFCITSFDSFIFKCRKILLEAQLKHQLVPSLSIKTSYNIITFNRMVEKKRRKSKLPTSPKCFSSMFFNSVFSFSFSFSVSSNLASTSSSFFSRNWNYHICIQMI